MILRALPWLLMLWNWPQGSRPHKLENFLDKDTGSIDPSVSTSLYLRQPKFLFRSSGTTTVTTTLSTSTQCYTTVNVTGICGKRKKRSVQDSVISSNPIGVKPESNDEDGHHLDISPSATLEESQDLNQLNSSVDLDDLERRRDPRFLFNWYYTTTFSTVTSTVTTFIATTTVSLVSCVPTTFGINLCG